LNQDIEASANHRNILRHSLESYTSLLSRNADKPSLVIKICRQSTKLLQLSKNLCAPGRNQQEIASKSAHVPGLPFKDSFEPKPGYWGGKMSHQSKINTKKVFWPHEDSGFCGLATQNKAKEWLKAEGPLVPGNLASQLKRLESFGLFHVERS
jgi:hypothetical protein